MTDTDLILRLRLVEGLSHSAIGVQVGQSSVQVKKVLAEFNVVGRTGKRNRVIAAPVEESTPATPAMTCPTCGSANLTKTGSRRLVGNGARIQRWRCKECRRGVSAHHGLVRKQQHHPEMNLSIVQMALAGKTVDEICRKVGCAKNTVELKQRQVGAFSRAHHEAMPRTDEQAWAMVIPTGAEVVSSGCVLLSVLIGVETGEVLAFDFMDHPLHMADVDITREPPDSDSPAHDTLEDLRGLCRRALKKVKTHRAGMDRIYLWLAIRRGLTLA